MRLLWLKSDYVLPPDTGGKIRSYNLLRQLNGLCEVTYASFRPHEAFEGPGPGERFATAIRTWHRPEENKAGLGFYARVLAGMGSSKPYIVQKYTSEAFKAFQRQWSAQPNADAAVILCDFLEMSENVEWGLPYPKVLFQHNVETMIWRRYVENEAHALKRAYFAFESRRMARYETAACNKFDLVLTVSREDKRMLQEEFRVRTPVEVVETGVDVEFFSPLSGSRVVPSRLLFVGSLDWMPNVDGLRWFASSVYPLIQREHPEVSLHVVGRRPMAAVCELEKSHPSLRIFADVPDVREHLAAADVVVVPLRVGGGSRIKIYEAMAMGRPVVSTTVGAEGLPIRDGVHIAIGDAPTEFARRVGELLSNEHRKATLALAGARFVTENCSWRRVAKEMYGLCQGLVRQGKANESRTSSTRA